MPNWCHNKLIVSGDPDVLGRFVQEVKESDDQPLSFEKHLPTPSDPDARDGSPFPGWYDWRVTHWGTKWDASFGEPFVALGTESADVEASVAALGSEVDPDLAVTVARFKFDTAWSPPEPWLEHVASLYPDLRFVLEFGEPGNGYAGRQVYESGLMVHEQDLPVEEVLDESEMWF